MMVTRGRDSVPGDEGRRQVVRGRMGSYTETRTDFVDLSSKTR